jgi:hypothetical protein
MSRRKKICLWALGIVLTPFLLFVLLAVLLYLPPVQNWAVKTAARMASESTGMNISVGHVQLRFPLDLALDDVNVLRQNDSLPQLKDTVADVKRAVLDVQLLPLFKKQVNIDNLELCKVKMNTATLIHSARVKGSVENLKLSSHSIWLKGDSLKVDIAQIDSANLDIALSDTVPPDTTPSKNFWKIYAQQLSVKHSNVTVHTPGDTLQIGTHIGGIDAKRGFFDLYKGLYRVGSFDWTDGALTYDNNFKTHSKGLDANHLNLSGINIGVDSLYYCTPKLYLNLRTCAFREKSGIAVDNLAGPVSMDSTMINLPKLTLQTPESRIEANFVMDFTAFDDVNPGRLKAIVHGAVGKQDIMRFLGDMPAEFRRRWPNYPLRIDGVLTGNMKHAVLQGVDVSLPTAFRLRADGTVGNVTDMNHLKANLQLKVNTYNLGFITQMLGPSFNNTISIPSGIGFNGKVNVNGKLIATNFTATQGGGSLSGRANINTKLMAYNADLKARSLPVNHFVKGMGLRPLTASVNITGVGTDVMSTTTSAQGSANIKSFGISGYAFNNIAANIKMSHGMAHAAINSNNSLLKGVLNFDALMSTKRLRATISGDVAKMDFNKLHITDYPLTAAFCAKVDLASDLNDYYKAYGNIGDITLIDSVKTYRPEDIDMDILTRRDTTHAIVDCGDFRLMLNAKGGYKRLMKSGNRIMAEMQKQVKKRYIDQALIRRTLPLATIHLNTGNNNFFVRLMQKMGYSVDDAYINLTSSPEQGLNGSLLIDKLIADGVQIDTLRLALASDSTGMTCRGQIRNNEKNPQYVFNSLFDGGLNGNSAFVNAKIYDAENRLGVQTGLTAKMEQNGIRMSMNDNNQILGYKKFNVNSDNYVFLADNRRVSANLKLTADDGTGVQVYTNDSTEALQDITVGLNDFDLKHIMAVIPYAPKVTGVMNGDFHLIQTKDELSVASDISVDKMTYEDCPIGDLSTEFVYIPKGDGTHYVSGSLSIGDNEVGTITGSYNPKGEGTLDATAKLDRLPLNIINGFIPDRIMGFKGYGDGTLSVKGSLSKPKVDGEVYLDSCYLVSEPYGVELRFDDDPVTIVGSHLLFENFEMYAHNDSPLNVSGSLDFSDMNNMLLNLKMQARNFKIIDAKENPRSETFGKAYVNFFGMMNGPVNDLNMRGRLDVLGSTNMTYVLRDSPLSNDNSLDGLVEFVNFSDTTATNVVRPSLTGFNMDLSVNVDEGARVVCQLNADGSNYIDVQGGGDLRLQYNPADNMRLTGRYTLNNGEMKYSLPVIPLKTFTIQEGSYVDFLGDPMNPKLNITATEQTKASVSGSSSQGHTVTFDCGVLITKTLQNMGLEFIIDAPNDMSVHSQLMSMSTEERGKAAVAMLTTGMYIVDGNTSSFSMNSALSAFLNGQISSITGNALRTLDLSFGVDNTTTSTGSTQTDYSFKFAKRFWNNRLRITVGGKVSTGADVANQNEQFFNNVTFEYRMDQNSTKYLKLFYDRDSYDWLEGNVGEYGAGFMWRRKLLHFKDMFKFKDDNMTMPPANADTLKNEKVKQVK